MKTAFLLALLFGSFVPKPDGAIPCAFADCPSWVIEQTLIEMHGSLPTSYYERGTKAWMKAYCEYSPEMCH